MFPVEKSGYNFIENQFLLQSHHFFVTFELFFVCVTWQFDWDVSKRGFIVGLSSWGVQLASWRYRLFSSNLVFDHYLFLYSFCPFLFSPSGTPVMHKSVHRMVFFRSLKLSLHFFILFLFHLLRFGNSIDLSSSLLILSSSCLNLHWALLVNF